MDNKYFENVNTLEELRKQYKELLKKYYPDNGGDVAQIQEINREYDRLFKLLKNRHEGCNAGNGTSGNESKSDYSSMKYDFAEDEKLPEILNSIIHFEGIDIELVGAWIWVSGNTYKYKKELKEIGFRWASQKKMWYWHSEAYRKKSRKVLSMDDIRGFYGSTRVEREYRKQLQQA